MNAKRWLTFGMGLILAAGLFIFLALPPILRALPSRYVAAMPEPLQELGVRDHVEILPTAAATADVASLLPTATASPTLPPPPTATPLSTATAVSEPTATPTATPLPTATPIPFAPTAEIYQNIEHQFQAWNNCGPATLAMGLSNFGLYLVQDDTARVLKPNPEDRNVTPAEMVAYVNEQTDLQSLWRLNGNLTQIKQFVSNGIPVIIETGIDPPGQYAWMDWYGHYLLVVGYDDATETVWVYDSWLGTSSEPPEFDQNGQLINLDATNGRGRPIKYATFDRYWRQFSRTYMPIYRPEQAELVSSIIGSALDDGVMWSEALEVAQAELAEDQENAYLWFNLGTIYNGLGEYEKAAAAFDQARSMQLPWRMLWYQFGPYEAYLANGRYQDIIELANVTLHQRPYFEESFYYRGLAHAALGDLAQARADLEDAIQFNPNFQPARAALAELEGENTN